VALKDERSKIGLAWAILAIVLLISTLYYQFHQLWGFATVATEFCLFAMFAFVLLKPSVSASLATLLGSVFWLINQLDWWYLGIGTNMALFTAIMNTFLLAFVLYSYMGKKELFTFTTIFSETGASYPLVLAFIVTVLYGVWKVYIDFVVHLPTATTNGPLSGGLWAFGITLMAFASLSSLFMPKAEVGSVYWAVFAIAMLGLIIAGFAALAYGQWLFVFPT
jgi:hypothetical protein